MKGLNNKNMHGKTNFIKSVIYYRQMCLSVIWLLVWLVR